MIEYSITLRTVLERNSDATNDIADNCSEIESDNNVSSYNSDAFNGNIISDEGWQVWTGSVHQLKSPDFSFSSPSRSLASSARHHESLPPALLPGCKVIRHVNIQKDDNAEEDDTEDSP